MIYLSWVVFGLIAGFLAYLLDPKPADGAFVGAIILGILGAVVAGMLADLILSPVTSGFSITSVIVALAGSVALVFVSRFFKEA